MALQQKYHLLQHVHALLELRAFQLQRLQSVLQGCNGQAIRVLLLPLPLAVPLICAPAQWEASDHGLGLCNSVPQPDVKCFTQVQALALVHGRRAAAASQPAHSA